MLFPARFSAELRRLGRSFTLQSILSVPENVGVYVLYYGPSFVYVGKTGGLRSRLTQHYNGSHNERLAVWLSALDGEVKVTYLRCSEEEVDDLERSLIKYLQPIANIDRFTGYDPVQVEWRSHDG